jgi:hypothetical protein
MIPERLGKKIRSLGLVSFYCLSAGAEYFFKEYFGGESQEWREIFSQWKEV